MSGLNINPSRWIAPECFESNIRYDMPFRDYMLQPAVSKTFLGKFSRCKREAKQWLQNPDDERTESMVIGSLVDQLIFGGTIEGAFHLRPEELDGEKWQGNRKVCKAWKLAHSDKPILTADEHANLMRIAHEVAEDKDAQELIQFCKPQVSFFARHPETGLLIKGRPDWCGDGVLVDLKYTSDAERRAFNRTITNLRYHVQAGLYCEGIKLAGGNADKFWFIAVEGGTFPQVNVRTLEKVGIACGAEIARRELVQLRKCIDSGDWPGLSERTEDGKVLPFEVSAGEVNRIFDLDNPASLEAITEVLHT